MDDGRTARGPRALVGLVLVALAAAAVSWWLGPRARPPAAPAAGTRPVAARPVTAPVERRVLRDVLTLPGTVRASRLVEVEVEPRVEGGRAVVTRAPLSAGATVEEGERLVEVSGRPVFALGGAIPMYRDLGPGSEGEDVAQLQAALERLGFPTGDRRGRFGPGTAEAVRRFYRSRDYEPVAAPPATPPGGQQGAAGIALPASAPTPTTAATTPTPTPTTSPAATSPPGGAPELVVPWSEVVFVDRLPARVLAAPAVVGQRPAGPLLTLTAGDLVAEAPLTAADRAAVRVGDPASVEAEEGTRVEGAVAFVGPAGTAGQATPPGGAAQAPDPPSGQVLRVKAKEGRPIPPALLGREVRVSVETARTERPVLAVPVGAISADADGTPFVTRADPDGTETRLAVTPGLSAGGFVELRSVRGQLDAGDLVVVGRRR